MPLPHPEIHRGKVPLNACQKTTGESGRSGHPAHSGRRTHSDRPISGQQEQPTSLCREETKTGCDGHRLTSGTCRTSAPFRKLPFRHGRTFRAASIRIPEPQTGGQVPLNPAPADCAAVWCPLRKGAAEKREGVRKSNWFGRPLTGHLTKQHIRSAADTRSLCSGHEEPAWFHSVRRGTVHRVRRCPAGIRIPAVGRPVSERATLPPVIVIFDTGGPEHDRIVDRSSMGPFPGTWGADGAFQCWAGSGATRDGCPPGFRTSGSGASHAPDGLRSPGGVGDRTIPQSDPEVPESEQSAESAGLPVP